MASTVITSYFSRFGNPAINLSGGYPKLRIWEVIDGTPSGDVFISEKLMIKIEDGVNNDGMYKYEFTDVGDGFNPLKTYLFRTDGGPTLPAQERYQIGQLVPDSIDEALADHIHSGSVSEAIALTRANTQNIVNELYLNADSVKEIVDLILKFDTNRTRVDPSAGTLTVFDDDCITPLRTFNLYDSSGNLSSTEICERVPTAAGTSDGKPTCI